MPQASITCPRCGRTSYNDNDVRERYCGNCHAFHDELLTPPNTAPPMTEVWAIVSRDEQGRENVCGVESPIYIQFMTGNEAVWKEHLLPIAKQMKKLAKGSGRTIHALHFTHREEIDIDNG